MKNNSKIMLSIVLPLYNEEQFISEVIHSIIKSASKFLKIIEIIIVNNQSTDDTILIAKKILMKKNFIFTIIDNDTNNTSIGFNEGIKASNGDYIMIMGGHTLLNESYFDILLNEIKHNNKWDCIGGKHEIIANNFNQNIIKTILTSSFGVGNARFRTSNVVGNTDTVPYGTYKKNVFKKFGLFNESYIRNQDLEYNLRLNSRGGKVFYEPNLITYYRLNKDNSLINFLKKYFNNGKWIGLKIFENESWSWRHIIPLLFLLIILFCLVLVFFYEIFELLLIAIIVFHFCIGVYFSFMHTKNFKLGLVMPFFYILFHLTYGSGTLHGIISKNGN